MCVDCEREVIAGLREDIEELQTESDRLRGENERLREIDAALRDALTQQTKSAERYYIERDNLRKELHIANQVMEEHDRLDAETVAKAAKLDNLANILRDVVD